MNNTTTTEAIRNVTRAVEAEVGSDGSADIRTIVETALEDNPAVTVEEIAEIVREARKDASIDG